MSKRRQQSEDYDLDGGRRAFMTNDAQFEDPWTTPDAAAELIRQQSAMCSFTESVDDDLPPAPELPPSLDIDYQYPNNGFKTKDISTAIVEMTKKFNEELKKADYDKTLGATQKYPLVVSGPGRVDAEQELHESLLNKASDSSSPDIDIDLPLTENDSKNSRHHKDSLTNNMHDELVHKCSVSALQRPRPTTPTSWCAIENYVEECSASTSTAKKLPTEAEKQKMRIIIPSKDQPQQVHRRRKSSMSWSEFYETMSAQMPPQGRSISLSGRSTPAGCYDADILEQDPSYRSIAPPKPVVHRRASTEWESFEDKKFKHVEETASSTPSRKSSDLAFEPVKKLSVTSRKKSSENGQQTNQFEGGKILNQETVEIDVAANGEKCYRTTSEQQQYVTINQRCENTEMFPTSTAAATTSKRESISTENTKKPSKNVFDTNDEFGGRVPELPDWRDSNARIAPVTADTNPFLNNFEPLATDSINTFENVAPWTEPQQPASLTDVFAPLPDIPTTQTDYSNQFNTAIGKPSEFNQNAADVSNFYNAKPLFSSTTPTSYNPFAQVWEEEGTTGTPYQQQAEVQPQEPQPTSDQLFENTEQNQILQPSLQHQADTTIIQSQFYPPVPDSSNQSYDYSATPQQNYDGQHNITEQNPYDNEAKDYIYPSEYDYGYSNAQQPIYEPQITDASLTTDFNVQSQPQQLYTDYDNYESQQYYMNAADQSINNQQTDDTFSTSVVPPEPNPSAASFQQPKEIMQPQFIKPLLPEFNRPAPLDPFSWEAQEMNAATTSSQQTSSFQQIPPHPPMPRPPSQTIERPELVEEEGSSPSDTKKPKKPPPRPAPPPPSARSVPPPPRPKVPPSPRPPRKEIEPEVDAWTQFKQLTEKASEAVKETENKLKILSETTVAKDVKDESYIAQIGGSQMYVPELAQRKIRKKEEELTMKKAEKKKMKAKGRKTTPPEVSPLEEERLNRAAEELAKKMASSRVDLEDWKPPSEREAMAGNVERENMNDNVQLSARKISDDKAKIEESAKKASVSDADGQPKTFIDYVDSKKWTAFDDQAAFKLPPSDSDFFATAPATSPHIDEAFLALGGTAADSTLPQSSQTDPFAPPDSSLIDADYDPFDIKPAEEMFGAAKARAAAESAAAEVQNDLEFFGGVPELQRSASSTPVHDDVSTASSQPTGFDDEFHVDADAESLPTPLYDEDDTEELTDYPPKFTGDGWDLMIRYPIKKKLMGDRFWKPCFVKLQGCTLYLCDSRKDQKPFQELLLQTCYSLSDTALQAYDVYGKIHTVKLQYVVYKERVGIRPGQISRLVEGHVTKYGLPLEHSAQCTVLLKFGCLNSAELTSFIATVEDLLFRCPARRELAPVYKQDEVQIHCYDEYSAYVDKFSIVSEQKARVRLFCLAFLTGSPFIEIGLNDRRREGKEIVRRKDILPMYTERWIRFENIEFHNTVDQEQFDREQVIRFQPPDGCFFEVMRFRIRPPKNREKPVNVKSIMKIAGSKIEIRIEIMVAAQIQKSKSGKITRNQIPCEDIQIRFPIPEAWIYLFREERNWGVGSVHAKVRRPGKNLKDRLMGVVQTLENSLIEVAIGEAKYEHIYRSLVWRIPRLPEKHHEAYKRHLLKCHFELSSFDLMPESFLPTCDVDFTMPLATISNTVVRSVSVEQHEDSDRVEKFVRYVAKCAYKVEIDYVQCSTLDVDAIFDPTKVNPEASQDVIPEPHKPAFDPNATKNTYAGYRIELPDENIDMRKKTEDSSSDDDELKGTPMIQIDMKGYEY